MVKKWGKRDKWNDFGFLCNYRRAAYFRTSVDTYMIQMADEWGLINYYRHPSTLQPLAGQMKIDGSHVTSSSVKKDVLRFSTAGRHFCLVAQATVEHIE